MPYAQHFFIYNEAQINFFVHFCSQYAKHGLDICRHDRPYSGMSALSPHAIRKTVRRRKGWPRAAPEGGGRRRSGKVPRGAANDVDGRFPVRQDGRLPTPGPALRRGRGAPRNIRSRAGAAPAGPARRVSPERWPARDSFRAICRAYRSKREAPACPDASFIKKSRFYQIRTCAMGQNF